MSRNTTPRVIWEQKKSTVETGHERFRVCHNGRRIVVEQHHGQDSVGCDRWVEASANVYTVAAIARALAAALEAKR